MYSIDGYSEWANRIILWQITSSYAVSKSGCFFSRSLALVTIMLFDNFLLFGSRKSSVLVFFEQIKFRRKLVRVCTIPSKSRVRTNSAMHAHLYLTNNVFATHIHWHRHIQRKRERERDAHTERGKERRTQTKIHVYCNEKAKNFNFQLHHKTNYLTTLTISNYNTIEMNPFNIMPAKSMWMS